MAKAGEEDRDEMRGKIIRKFENRHERRSETQKIGILNFFFFFQGLKRYVTDY